MRILRNFLEFFIVASWWATQLSKLLVRFYKNLQALCNEKILVYSKIKRISQLLDIYQPNKIEFRETAHLKSRIF